METAQENKNQVVDQQENFSQSMQSNQGVKIGGKKENFFKEIIKFALLAVIIVLPIRLFVAQPFIVSGASMDPTFADGQYLIVDQISYRFDEPKRGDVIIFRYPKNTKKFFIKRIIGLPSETVEIKDGQVAIKNKENKNGFAIKEPYINDKKIRNDQMSITLKDDEYFVMGDNRTESSDSRLWGPLKRSLVIGRPFVRLFPVRKIGLFPGAKIPEEIKLNNF